MTGPRPPGRWMQLAPVHRVVAGLRARPRIYRAVYTVWAVLRSLPFERPGSDPSQFGEGNMLVERLPASGLYLDIGCHEPVRFNNTWKLRRRGWRGWSVDASAFHKPLWRVLRPRDKFIHAAVVADQGIDHVEFFQFQPEYSGLSTLSPDRVQVILDRGDDHRATPVRVRALQINDLLAAYVREFGRYPDLLLTDVEGLDWALINAADPSRLREVGVQYLLLEDLSVLEGAEAMTVTPEGAVDFAHLAGAGWNIVDRAHLSVLLAAAPRHDA